MAFITKEWKDRIVEYAGRRRLTNVSTQEQEIVDVERAEGTVSQAGDAFSAANMNDLEQRISDEFTAVNENLTAVQNAMKFVPDYSHTISAFGFPFTAPSDGIAYLDVKATDSDVSIEINVNGIQVYHWHLAKGNNAYLTIPVLLAKNDVLGVTDGRYYEWGYVVFVPFKTPN